MANTANRLYPKPVSSNFVSDDVLLLQAALDMVDGDIQALLAALSGKASTVHGHAIGDITGLETALGGKAALDHAHALDDLSDVAGATAGATGYVLAKQADGTYGPVSPASIVGAHGHVIADITDLQTTLDGKLTASAFTGATLKATPADADVLGFFEVTGSIIKKLSFSNLQEWIRTKLGAMVSASSAKTTLVDADQILASDSAASNAPVKVSWLNLKANIKTYADTLYTTAAAVAAAYQPLKTILTTLGNLANASGYLSNNGSGTLSWSTPAASYANSQIFAASGTFTVPAGVTSIVAIAVGGGSCGTSDSFSSLPGQVGGIGVAVQTVTPGAALTVTVGAGSSGGGNTRPTAGSSVFNGVTATGGGTAAGSASGTGVTVLDRNSLNTLIAGLVSGKAAAAQLGADTLGVKADQSSGRVGTGTAAAAWAATAQHQPGASGSGGVNWSGGIGGAVIIAW